MSGFTLLAPAAIRLGAIRNTDIDSAFSLDWTANMTARQDTITSLSAITVARSDGAALGPASPPEVAARTGVTGRTPATTATDKPATTPRRNTA